MSKIERNIKDVKGNREKRASKVDKGRERKYARKEERE